MNGARLVLIACFMVLLFNSGARFAMGLLLKPMAEDLQWTRSTLSLSVTVFMVVSALALPFMGRLVDGLGARRVLGFSVALFALSIAALPLVHSPIQMLFLYGIIFALGSAGTSITPIGVLLSRWYPQRIGMANSIAISGMGLGQLLVISVLASVLTDIGWQGAYLGLGVVTLVIVLPLVLVAGRGSSPPASADAVRSAGAPAEASSLSEVLRTHRLWLLLALYAVCGFQDFLVATHMVAYALDEGIDGLVAGNMLAFMGLAGLAGVLATGWLNDRAGPALPTLICFVARIVLFGLLLVSREPAVIVAMALLYGATFWITAPLTVVFAGQCAGPALLGTLSGLITMVHHGAGGLGAYVGASIFDASGSYHEAFTLMLVLSVVAAALTLMLRTRT